MSPSLVDTPLVDIDSPLISPPAEQNLRKALHIYQEQLAAKNKQIEELLQRVGRLQQKLKVKNSGATVLSRSITPTRRTASVGCEKPPSPSVTDDEDSQSPPRQEEISVVTSNTPLPATPPPTPVTPRKPMRTPTPASGVLVTCKPAITSNSPLAKPKLLLLQENCQIEEEGQEQSSSSIPPSTDTSSKPEADDDSSTMSTSTRSNDSSHGEPDEDNDKEADRNVQHDPLPFVNYHPRRLTYKRDKLQELPRELELEQSIRDIVVLPNEEEADTTTMPLHVELPNHAPHNDTTYKVKMERLVDANGDSGLYTGRLSSDTHLPHGKGRMVYDAIDDESETSSSHHAPERTYMGHWDQGLFHGKGHLMVRDDYSYRGDFMYGHMQGLGLYQWNDGRSYQGHFYRDKRHGRGVLTFPDGALYDGEFINNIREGHGVFYFSEGGHYNGEWRDGVFHGRGECLWNDGRIYRGDWEAGKAHGQGIEIYPNGAVRHEGEFRDDEPVKHKHQLRKEHHSERVLL